jgi:hypothetical protein
MLYASRIQYATRIRIAYTQGVEHNLKISYTRCVYALSSQYAWRIRIAYTQRV